MTKLITRTHRRLRRRRDAQPDDTALSLIELMAVVAIMLILGGVGYLMFVRGADTAERAAIIGDFSAVRDQIRLERPSRHSHYSNGVLTKTAGGYIPTVNGAIDGIEVVNITDWLGTDRHTEQIGMWSNPFPITIKDTSATPNVEEVLPRGSYVVLLWADAETSRCISIVQSRKFNAPTAYMWVDKGIADNTAFTMTTLADVAHCGLAATNMTTATNASSACTPTAATACGGATTAMPNTYVLAGAVTGFADDMGAGSTAGNNPFHWSGLTGSTAVGTTKYICTEGWPTAATTDAKPATADRNCPS